ncbi:NPCBM/NEW2 domain-containing protein, partial [Clostridium perfringens]|uniref:NPCBM/NEW2 domain-containing protein n=1 Tax=Clostridium perfringens TaxID=1502 RepID=UPI0024BD0A82
MKYKKISCIILTSCLILSLNPTNYTVLANENIHYNKDVQLQEENDNYIFLSDLEYDQSMSNTSWSTIKFDKNIDGGKITLNVDNEPLEFDKGIGAHANSNVVFDVSKYSEIYTRFTTYVGIDRSQWDKGNGIKVSVFSSNDGIEWKEIAKTDTLKGNQNATFIDVDISGIKYLKLTANDNGSNGNDHAVYGSPRIMKADYDIGSEYLAGVKKVEYYDQLIKSKYNINSPITGEYERLLLQRTFVKRVGFNTIQSVAKLGSKYENAINWLVNNDNALKLYVTGGEIEGGGSYATSMKALADIYEKHNSDFSDTTNGELYLKMAIATSISHAKTIRLWTGNATPSDPCTRYEIYKNLYTSGLMAEGGNTELFKNLPVELMRWVMDNKIDDEEINWLVNHSLANKASGGNYLDAYTYITYTSGFDYNKDKYYEASKYNEWNKKYNISSLSDYGKKGVHKLWMVFEEGSVCGGLAKTYANLSQVFGMPAAVVGQPGHAATLSYSQNSEGKGIWNIKNDISGWVQSEKGERLPLGWGSKDWDSYYSVSYILLAQKALDDYDNLIKADYYNYLADVYKNDAEKQIEIYNKALEVQNYNLDSLVGLINAYKQSENKTSNDYLKLAQRVADGLAFFPLPFVDVMKLIEPNITNDSDKVIFDILKTKTLKRATIATENDTVQPNACKTMANHLLGQNKIELATFSFDGENAGKIKINDVYSNSSIRWEYSLDGWASKKETDAKEVTLSKEELEKINKDQDIQISLVGTSEIYIIDITQYDAPKNLYVNDLENQFRGFNGNLEYSEDNGATWNKYNAENTRILGDKKILVRYIASGTKMQSEPVEYSFTEDNQPANRKYVQLKNVSLYKYSSQQNNGDAAAVNMIDGNINTGWHNTWAGEENKYYAVEFDKPRYITSIEYKPGGVNGKLRNVDIYTSLDGEKWEKAGEATNLQNNDELKILNLDKPTKAKFVKLQARNTYGNPTDVFFTGRMLNFFEDTTIKEIKDSVNAYNVYFNDKDSSLYINASFEGIDNPATEEFTKVAKLVDSQGQEVEGAVITTQNF